MLTSEQKQAIAISYRITPAMAKVFELLLEANVATNRMIEATVEGNGTPAKLVIYRLRSQLQHTSIRIHKRTRVGYWLDAGTKAFVMQVINSNTKYCKGEVDLKIKEPENGDAKTRSSETL